MDPSVGHLNGILARIGGNLNNNFQKSQVPGGCPGGMLKLRFDRYIRYVHVVVVQRPRQRNEPKSDVVVLPTKPTVFFAVFAAVAVA